jgi:hypothetical protein
VANSFLSPTIITREALRVLHANLNFIGSINRQYDKQFANEGASPSGKIGPTLTIRMPNQFTVRQAQPWQFRMSLSPARRSPFQPRRALTSISLHRI